MKEFQIEKVNHSSSCGVDRYLLTSYYPSWEMLVQTNFATERRALECKGIHQTGLWRVKPRLTKPTDK